MSIKKEVARWLRKYGGPLGKVVAAGSWLWEHKDDVLSYLDEPRTLEELQEAATRPPKKGYENHHIAEQTAARDDGFDEDRINGRDNVVRIPRLKHQEINGWYGRKNPEFGGKPPREHLRGRTWEERISMGHRALREHGALKP